MAPSAARSIVGEASPVNIDFAFTFERKNFMNLRENEGRFGILFVQAENKVSPREVVWRFVDECDRDEVLEAIRTQFVKSL